MSERVIVATAGHIDHGKTSLVRALTGVDLDVAPEEQRRGITIQLGFCPLDLPGGGGVAFIDVPGHERLVRTMIAGAHGVDAAMLCVSAVDGAMPQTREHLAILGLLGLKQGVVVLTLADLVDDELLELVREDVRDLVADTFLEGAPVIPVSSLTGAGLDALRADLARLVPCPRVASGPFRLPVDRAFSRAGFGTVVTGTSMSGSLRVGDVVTLAPGGGAARVRGLEVHGAAVEEVGPGRRVAVNLAGVEVEAVGRGATVVRGIVPSASVLDVRYHHVDEDDVLADGAQVRVLLGTADVIGRIWLTGRPEVAPEEAAWAQLRLDAPLVALPGDHFVLRRPSPARTLGGGVVLDPWAPRVRPRDAVPWADQLARLLRGDRAVWLERAGPAGVPVDDVRAADGVVLGDRAVAAAVRDAARETLLGTLADAHRASPLARGVRREAARLGVLKGLSERAWEALLAEAVAAGEVVDHGPLIALAGHRVVLDAPQLAAQVALEAALRGAGLAGLDWAALKATQAGPWLDALVALLVGEGRLHQLPQVGFVHDDAIVALRAALRDGLADGAALSPAAVRDQFGLTRKTIIPLLEWTDKQGWTRRRGDERVAGARLHDA